MKTTTKKPRQEDPPTQVSAEQALERMKRFAERKEKFVAAIKTSKN